MNKPGLWVRWMAASTVVVALLVAGCGRRATPAPAPTLAPTPQTAASDTVQVVDATPEPAGGNTPNQGNDLSGISVGINLLRASGVLATCDHSPAAVVTCVERADGWQMDIEVTAATFARWRLLWDSEKLALTGDETLALDVRRQGTLTPNVYVVERDGTRFYVNLSRYGLQRADDRLAASELVQTIHIPLREFRDEAGQRPRFAEITEVQVVFEWADMQGTLALDALRFEAVWQEPVTVSDQSRSLAEALQVPPGFTVEVVADGLREMTQIQFAADGTMLVALQGGRVWWYTNGATTATGDAASDEQQSRHGTYVTRRLYESGFPEIVGLLFDPVDHAVWIGGRGQLMRTLDTDGNGVADQRDVRIDDMPWGRHQNNGLTWNPIPDPFTGEAPFHWLYFGLGSVDDLDVGSDKNAAIVRFPRDGQGLADLEIVSLGNRNAYDLVWAPVLVESDESSVPNALQWVLFASENGPDFNDAPDEVNHIRWQHHYGFPDHFGPLMPGEIDGEPFSGPVYPVAAHASADGVAYVTKTSWPEAYRTLYVSLFGEVFSPEPVGHVVQRVILTPKVLPDGEVTFRGEADEFVGGLDRPLPLTTGPSGDLIVGDYATGVIYRISYAGDSPAE